MLGSPIPPNFDKGQYIIFSFWIVLLVLYLLICRFNAITIKTPAGTKVTKIFFYVFFWKLCRLRCVFTSAIHVEFISVYGVRYGSKLIFFFAYEFPVVLASFIKKIILSLLTCLCTLVENQ